MTRRLFSLALIAATLVPGFTSTQGKLNWGGPRVREMSGRRGSHRFTLRIEQANFSAGHRKVTVKKDGSVLLDGMPTYGRDWSPSRSRSEKMDELRHEATEIVRFHTTIDGKPVRIPSSLYAGLFNPNLDKQHLTAKLSKDGGTLVVKMEASDGAGSYRVTWNLRRNGKSSRHAEHEED